MRLTQYYRRSQSDRPKQKEVDKKAYAGLSVRQVCMFWPGGILLYSLAEVGLYFAARSYDRSSRGSPTVEADRTSDKSVADQLSHIETQLTA